MKISDGCAKDIAEELQMGMSCYIHKKTQKLISIPKDFNLAFDEEDEEFQPWNADIKKIQKSPKSFIEVDQMSSREAYQLMEDFISTITNNHFRIRLENAIAQNKPFQRFNFEIMHDAQERARWFAFKEQRMIEWIKEQLEDA